MTSSDGVDLIIIHRPALKALKDPGIAALFGLIWFKAGKGAGICSASPGTLGAILEVNPKTVRRHLKILCDRGYLIDLTPEDRERSQVHDYKLTAAGLSLTRDGQAGNDSKADEITDKLSLNGGGNSGQNVPYDADDEQNTGQNVLSDSDKGQNVPTKGQNVQQKELKSLTDSLNPIDLESLQQPESRAHTCGDGDYLDDLSDLPEIKNAARKLTPEQQAVWAIYETNISPTESPITIEAIWSVYDDLSPPPGETRLDQFREAIQAACDNGHRRWSYVRGALDHITEAGGIKANREQFENQKQQKVLNGRTNKTGPTQTKRGAQRTPAPGAGSTLWAIEPDRSYLDEYLPPAGAAD